VPDPERNPFAEMTEAHCYAGGECATPPGRPGRYWVVALPGTNTPDTVDLRDVETRRRFGAWGREVDLLPGDNPVIDLELVSEEIPELSR